MDKNIQSAIEVLKSGGIGIFPTDTVYGIGCRLDDEKALKKLFAIRNRPEEKAVLAVVDSIKMAEEYLLPIPEDVRKELMEKYWPGGLTIILPCHMAKVPSIARGGGKTLGVRQTNHPALLEILKEIKVPLVAPSANFAGEATPKTYEQLDPNLSSLVDVVIEGECGGDMPSTVIDCSVKPWKILREGGVRISSVRMPNMKNTKRLIFIRHGQTDENLENILHVHHNDEKGINKQGERQIKDTVKVCRENNVEVVFCSPETRAVESAKIITRELNIDPPIEIPELLERNWGDWEGRPWKDVERELNNMDIESRYVFVPPHGESWREMEHRLQHALDKITHGKWSSIAIITHGGALRGLLPILKASPKEISFAYQFHNASISIFDYKNDAYKEVIINDISHFT